MRFRTFIIFLAIIIGWFGLCFLIVPDWIVSWYGSELDQVGRFISRYYGSAMLGLSVTWFMVLNSQTRNQFLRGGALGGVVLGVTGLIVSIMDQIAGTHPHLTWLNILLYSIATIGFTIYYIMYIKKKD
jgi:hypothetical protein